MRQAAYIICQTNSYHPPNQQRHHVRPRGLIRLPAIAIGPISTRLPRRRRVPYGSASASVRSPIFGNPFAARAASRAAIPGSTGRLHRLVMNRRIEVVSYCV